MIRPPPDTGPRSVVCPACGSTPGDDCSAASGRPLDHLCPQRVLFAALYRDAVRASAADTRVTVPRVCMELHWEIAVHAPWGTLVVEADDLWYVGLVRPGMYDPTGLAPHRGTTLTVHGVSVLVPTGDRVSHALREAFTVWAQDTHPRERVARTLAALDEVVETGGPPLITAGCGVMSQQRWRPAGPDGRHTIAGFTEPYPLAWPYQPLADAYAGDLSALWPYLAG